jgi:ATP-dependent RNA helicase RhlE
MLFTDLNLLEPLLRAVTAEGYDVPTPIQQQAIPHVLAGRDLLGCAQTGTGKTAAFALPILQRLFENKPNAGAVARPIRVLVLTPTRELASQIGESFTTYGKHLRFRNTVIFGGVGQGAQEKAIAQGPEIVIATPGRLLDLAQQRRISFRDLEIFVLDEADRMLDMGFIHDVRRVIALLPQTRQTLFFSATMPPDIIELSSRILHDPARVAVTPIASTAEKVEQSVYFVSKTDKSALLEHVLQNPAIERVLVFSRTKHGANRISERLEKAGIGSAAIHGNKSQNARERALASFKAGSTRVLVATDIAARGIDIDGVTHVINFDLPDVAESYVHRIGRTARAGASGIALSFCDSEELAMLTSIERLIRMRIGVIEDHPLRGNGGRRPPTSPVQQQPQQHNQNQRQDTRAPRTPNPGQPYNGPRFDTQGSSRRGTNNNAPARSGGPGPARPQAEGAAQPAAPPPGGGPRRNGPTPRSQRRYVTS